MKRKSGSEVQRKQLKKRKKDDSLQNVRKIQLQEANDEENRSIKRLEKLLKLNKKKKKISTLFRDDGLDYILDVVDKNDEEGILSDDSLNFEDDIAAVKGSSSMEDKTSLKNSSALPPRKNRTLKELMKEKGQKVSDESSSNDASDSESDNFSTIDSASDKEESEHAENSNDDEIEENKIVKPKIWEDMYGRLRDEFGKVLKNNDTTSQLYVPPKKKNENMILDEKKQEQRVKIKKQLKGLLNRLSEFNLQNICSQIEEMYMKHSRNDMNETLFNLISELLFSPILTPTRIILDQAMLISLLHANVGSEVGAFFLQHIVEKLDALFKSENYGEGKECNNLLIFLSHLYNFKVTHSTLVFDVFEILIESFKSKDIELIQLFLKTIGFVLRKDDPLKLKELILSIQAKATIFQADQNDSRVRFMLDTLTVIKNNNIYKIPDYDPSIIEHCKKLLKGFIRKGSSIQELTISYSHLLSADEKGRWWIIGSAWSDGDNDKSKNLKNENITLPKVIVSEKILELARKQRMNTDVRKSIFCILMTAEDFMDAFEKLLKLNLKNQQKQEIIHVLLHCVLHEKNFNIYYAYLAGKFCKFSRENKMCLQFSLWDKFKDLSKMKSHQIKNLAGFLSHLFISDDLPISVLKTIQFAEMNKTMVRFFRLTLLPILLHQSEETCIQVFKRISLAPNLKILRDSLRFFMHHFLLRNQLKLFNADASILKERVKMVETVFKASKNVSKLK